MSSEIWWTVSFLSGSAHKWNDFLKTKSTLHNGLFRSLQWVVFSRTTFLRGIDQKLPCGKWFKFRYHLSNLTTSQLYSLETLIPVDEFSLFTLAIGLFYVLVVWLYLKKGNRYCLALEPSLRLGLVNMRPLFLLGKNIQNYISLNINKIISL